MQKDIMEREIAEIIKGFRQDSIEIEMNQEHVHKWISQFSPDTQNIILEETLHILKEWYFPKDKINLFLDKMMDYLKSENENATDEEPMKDIYFWNIQESGKSQSQLVEMLNDRVNQKYGCGIRTGKLMSEKYYVYLDDGLYTGSRLRKDIKRCIEMIPEGSRIDVIYMIACQSGLDFSKRILEELCKTKNIKINILRWREICNNKKIKRHDNGVSYEPIQDCLWPSSKLSKLPEISAYVEKLEEIKGKKVYYCFRNAGYKYTAGIFSNLVNRDIAEEEFLKKGIAITQNIQEHKGLYPLGYSYQSKYQGAKYYTQFMRNAAPVENQVEYSFELNTHNRTLLDQIQNAKRRSEALRKYPGSFAETLVALQKERKLSNKQLADRSLVGEKTIQRLRNDEEYPTSVQTVLALCVGLKLPLPEAEMFLGKTDFKLNSLKGEGYIYQCVMGACAENSIYEINEMLKENGITPLGSDPDLQ